LAAGRLAGGAGGVPLPRTPFAAGRAGGAGGAGGGAGLLTTSSRYAEGAHPDADLSNLLASHQPKELLEKRSFHQARVTTDRCLAFGSPV